jgi:pantoate--beta-alanine ligase
MRKRRPARCIEGAAPVQTIRRLDEARAAADELKRSGTLALVPTMGALHGGHMALIEEAKRRAVRVAATIFVNPMQFAAGEDLDRYPRQESQDTEVLERAGCDLLWLPSVEEVYGNGFATRISVAGLSGCWEGEARPGHFDGVATVVAKFLIAIAPHFALFGEKDFQQLAVIRRLAADLGLGAEIIGVPTVRDQDGLALSSRNAYLSSDERERALSLPSSLAAARDAIQAGTSVSAALREAKARLEAAGFDPIDYVALVDASTLQPLDAPDGEMRLIAAARIGSTRLIDNLPVQIDDQSLR